MTVKLNWLSPLPPARTGIADYSLFVLPHLSRVVDLRIFTFQKTWSRGVEKWGPVYSLSDEELIWTLLNRDSDLTVLHIGNNAEFHDRIWQVAHSHPSLVVLHDASLQHLFAGLYLHNWNSVEEYLAAVEACHGARARRTACRFLAGGMTTEELSQRYPMTRLAIEKALAVVGHSRRAMKLIEHSGVVVPSRLVPLPFPYRRRPPPKRPVPRGSEPFRLVTFGYMGPNRRLEPVLEALAGMPEKEHFHLEVFGPIWDPVGIAKRCKSLDLEDTVTIHGWVEMEELEAGLRRSHLALNLRDPTMGEASLSQLQIYSFALPSLVTRRGWYAERDPETVCFVRPHREIEDIRDGLRGLLEDPDRYARMGRKGVRVLRSEHSPAKYVAELLEMAEAAIDFQPQAVSWELAGIVRRKLESWHGGPRRTAAQRAIASLEELFRS